MTRCAKAAGMAALAVMLPAQMRAEVKEAVKMNATTVEVRFADGQRRTLDFYNDDIFRVFQDPQGGIVRDPKANPEAQILVNNPRREVTSLTVADEDGKVVVATPRVSVVLDKATDLMIVTDLATGKVVVEECAPVSIKEGVATVTLKADEDEYFYGGGAAMLRVSPRLAVRTWSS